MDSAIYSEAVGYSGEGSLQSPKSGSLLILGCRTEKVPVGDQLCHDAWDAQLYDGRVIPKTSGNAISSVELVSGTLYIGSALVVEPAMQMNMSAPFPVVVTKGTVVAGSTGTHWLTWTSGTSLFVALLEPPPGKAVGTVQIEDSASTPPARFSLYIKEQYVELVNGQLDAKPVAKSIAKDPAIAKLVQEAKARAALAGIRT